MKQSATVSHSHIAITMPTGMPEKEESLGICSYLCLGFISCVCLGFLLSLNIVELVFAYSYNIDECNSSIPIHISQWLIVKAITAITCTLLVCLSLTFSKFCAYPILLLNGAFNICWLIVGSIIFWRDCPNVGPPEVNSLMWASLILGYLSIIQLCTGKKE